MKKLYVLIALCALALCTAKTVKVQIAVTPQATVKAHPTVRPISHAEMTGQPEIVQPAPESAVFKNIYFDFDNATLRQDAIEQLRVLGSYLTVNTKSLQIDGHCDERGTNDYNIGLGQLRAQAAAAWLMSMGIPANRIDVNSYGKERLAVTGCDDDPCHQKNRRCEFTLK
jgi:peptidoglycan-associated lipoprotein